MMSLVKLFPACPALSRVRSAQVVEEWRAFKLHLRNRCLSSANYLFSVVNIAKGSPRALNFLPD